MVFEKSSYVLERSVSYREDWLDWCVVSIMKKNRILILDIGVGTERLSKILGPIYELACTTSVDEAIVDIRTGHFDMLILGATAVQSAQETIHTFHEMLNGEFKHLKVLGFGESEAQFCSDYLVIGEGGLADGEILQRVDGALPDDEIAPINFSDYVQKIKKLAGEANTTQEIADFAVRWLYDNITMLDGSPACSFTRFFRTMFFERLRPELKSQLVESLGSTPQAQVKCLTLMAGCGESETQNAGVDTNMSTCIPLDSKNLSQKVPMISLVVKQLGLDSSKIVSSDPGVFVDPEKKKYDVFHMDNLSASPFLGIESVVAFGTYMASGDFFAILMMLKVKISAKKAEDLQALARATEAAILEVIRRKGEGVAILLADSSYDRRVMQLLHERYRLIVAFSMEQVKVALDTNEVALIICDTRFDDSRMFELLANSRRNHNTTPILCIRVGKREGAQALHTAVDKAVLLQGARLMINAHALPDKDLLRIIQAYLPEPIWAA